MSEIAEAYHRFRERLRAAALDRVAAKSGVSERTLIYIRNTDRPHGPGIGIVLRVATALDEVGQASQPDDTAEAAA